MDKDDLGAAPLPEILGVLKDIKALNDLVVQYLRNSNSALSSTFSIFHPRGRQVITQKISSWAMTRSASSIDKTVRPNGPVEAHRSFQSDQ
jgi:hypothetical protein